MTASVQGNKSKAQEVKNEPFLIFTTTKVLDKTMCKFSANVAFNKATNEQTVKTQNVVNT